MLSRYFAILIGIIIALSRQAICRDINTYDAEFGVYVGELSSSIDSDLGGQVFIVNATTLQIFNFTFSSTQRDHYFWLDTKDVPTPEGVKAITFEYGIAPIGQFSKDQDRVVAHVPEKHRLDEFKSFSIYSIKSDRNYGSLTLPDNMKIPKSVSLQTEFVGKRYKLRSGPLYVIDKRTIKVYGFTFEGNKAPKTFFYAGRGSTVSAASGVKIGIRGKDDIEITEVSENYRGGKDIVLELPENYDIFHIDWISVYCLKYRVNFGSVLVSSDNTLSNLPPYVPPPKTQTTNNNDVDLGERGILRGTAERRNFTFQLADAEFAKPYDVHPPAFHPKYLWFVNSVKTPDLYLLRNVSYTFFVEGGREKMLPEFYNPLYISDDEHGGYSELSSDEVKRVTIYSPEPVDQNAGPLCVWMPTKSENVESDEKMYLDCDGWPEDTSSFVFTPNENTPSVLYYNSATNFYMGGRIFIVDEMPENVSDAHEITYSREKWHNLALNRQRNEKVNSAKPTLAAVFLFIVTLILA